MKKKNKEVSPRRAAELKRAKELKEAGNKNNRRQWKKENNPNACNFSEEREPIQYNGPSGSPGNNNGNATKSTKASGKGKALKAAQKKLALLKSNKARTRKIDRLTKKIAKLERAAK